MKTVHKNVFLAGAMVTVMCAAAGLLGYVALKGYDAQNRYRNTPTKETRNFQNAKVSFAVLQDRPLAQADLRPVITDIADPHVLSVYDDVLYVASWQEKKLYRIDLKTNQRKLLTDELDSIRGIAATKDGRLLATVFNENRVVSIDIKTGKVKTLATDLEGPSGIVPARDGAFYVLSQTSGKMVKLKLDGTYEGVADGLQEPVGVLADNDNVVTVTQSADPAQAITVIADNGKKTVPIRDIPKAEAILRDDERNTLITAQINGKGVLIAWPRGKEAKPLLLSELPALAGLATDGKALFTASPERNEVYRIEL